MIYIIIKIVSFIFHLNLAMVIFDYYVPSLPTIITSPNFAGILFQSACVLIRHFHYSPDHLFFDLNHS